MSNKSKGDLSVIMKSKDFWCYVLMVTNKSPKHFRFSFVTRIQNLAMDIIESLYRANDIYVSKNMSQSQFDKRIDFQRQAITSIRLLAYFSLIVAENGLILMKQYQHIILLSTECLKMAVAWMKSDKQRFGEMS